MSIIQCYLREEVDDLLYKIPDPDPLFHTEVCCELGLEQLDEESGGEGDEDALGFGSVTEVVACGEFSSNVLVLSLEGM